MNKTPDPGDVVRDKVVPAAEELVASLVERVGPFAKEAVDQVSPVAHAAAEKTVALAHVAAEMVAPLTHQALEAVTPYAQQTRDAVTPYAQQVGPLAQQAADRVGPLAQQAAVAAKDAFTGARERVSSDVLPAVGAAAATAAASATPLVVAATDKGRALVQSVRGEPVVVLPPPKKKRGWVTTVAVVAAAAGAAYVVVRKLVGDKGSQWQTARPSTPYASPVSAEAGVAEPVPGSGSGSTGPTDVVASTTSLYGTAGTGEEAAEGAVDDTDASAIAARNERIDEVADVDDGRDSAPAAGQTSGTWGEGSATDASASGGSAGTDGSAASSEDTFGGQGGGSPLGEDRVEEQVEVAEERVYEEPEAAVWAEEDTKMGGGPAEHPERYDLPGVYVGVEPPEGYTIKGNERSMKFHTSDSNSYGRTIAQVWFISEEAAEQAGFTKAQH